MKLLVISDIHGNKFGLNAVLEHARDAYDRVLCLGDVVGYGAHPNECCETVREITRQSGSMTLLGNHDAAALGKISIEWFNAMASAAVLWTRRELTEENRAWLDSLSPSHLCKDFQAVHASPRAPLEEYIVGRYVARDNFPRVQRAVCFFGHTHVAEVYACLDKSGQKFRLEQASLRDGGTFEIESGWKFLVNPGSCGQPRDGNPQARYAIYDSDENWIEVFCVDYDWQSAREAIFAAGLPPMLGDRLAHGK